MKNSNDTIGNRTRDLPTCASTNRAASSVPLTSLQQFRKHKSIRNMQLRVLYDGSDEPKHVACCCMTLKCRV